MADGHQTRIRRLEAREWKKLRGTRPRQAMLISVYVAPEHRGSGLADRMLRQAIEAARTELGAGVLQLGVHEDNGRAQRFYLRHGFQDTGAREPYPLDTDQSEIIMERVLPTEA